MNIDKKIMSALAMLLSVSYGITMAKSDVSLPGCGEGGG